MEIGPRAQLHVLSTHHVLVLGRAELLVTPTSGALLVLIQSREYLRLLGLVSLRAHRASLREHYRLTGDILRR